MKSKLIEGSQLLFCNDFKTSLNKCKMKVADLDPALSRMVGRISDLQRENESLCKENNVLKEKANRMEDCSRK